MTTSPKIQQAVSEIFHNFEQPGYSREDLARYLKLTFEPNRPSEGLLDPTDKVSQYYDLVCNDDPCTIIYHLSYAYRMLARVQPQNMFPAAKDFEAVRLANKFQEILIDFRTWRDEVYKILGGSKTE